MRISKDEKETWRGIAKRVRNVIESEDYKRTIGRWIEEAIESLPSEAAASKDTHETAKFLGGYYELKQLTDNFEKVFKKAEFEKEEKQKEIENDRREYEPISRDDRSPKS